MAYENIEAKSEDSKKSEDYLMQMTDNAIMELVIPKVNILKAYNYYHGYRDPEQFRHLEENFGIGNPTSVEFTPLVKKHIDVLVGEFLGVPIQPRITCKDKDTLSNINRDKQLKLYKELFDYLKQHVNNDLIGILNGQQKSVDASVQKEIDKIVDDLDSNFISEYEIAAQNVIDYLMQNRSVDFTNKIKTLLLDLLIAGMAFYRVKSNAENTNVELEILNPLQVFTDYNPEATYRKDDYRSVVVKYMNKSLILNKFGKYLTKEDIKNLSSELSSYLDGTDSYYILANADSPSGYPAFSPGLISYKDITPGLGTNWNKKVYNTQDRLLPVYDVEWTTTNKVGNQYVMDRYNTIKIGSDIYILNGKCENVIRSHDDPTYCGLSVNGIYFQDRNSEPFSLMLACANLQDKYDVVTFLRDTLLANSGTVGDWVDISQLPAALGADVTERIQKFIAYKKTGSAIIDTSQEGRAYNANTVFGGFDDTVKYPAVQALEAVLLSIENTCSSITGVFRERLNGIQQHDAVTNVRAGANNSFTATKQYYQQMDTLINGLLTDMLDVAKVVYKNGLTGSIVLGDKRQKIFTALPEYFTITDFDINIVSSTELLKLIEDIKVWILELIKNGQVPVEIVVEAIHSHSFTDMKKNMLKAIAKQKEENNQLQQLMQLNKQLADGMKEALNKIQLLTALIQQLADKKLQIEQDKINREDKRAWYEIQKKFEIDQKTIELREKQLLAETLLLFDSNNKNNEIKNIMK